jgi:hypothetical protein
LYLLEGRGDGGLLESALRVERWRACAFRRPRFGPLRNEWDGGSPPTGRASLVREKAPLPGLREGTEALGSTVGPARVAKWSVMLRASVVFLLRSMRAGALDGWGCMYFQGVGGGWPQPIHGGSGAALCAVAA